MNCVVFLFILALTVAPLRAADPPPTTSPHVFFVIGEPEYDTAKTLPVFAKEELEPRGIRCTFSILPDEKSDEFPNFDALKDADLLFVSVRRHAPPKEQMALIRAHVAAGKPVVGIRTASHAFGARKGEKEGAWENFGVEVLGGNYQGHYGKGVVTLAKIVAEAVPHPIIAGIGPEEFRLPSHLYKNPALPARSIVLVTARMEGRPEVEPVAWINAAAGGRVFYTSLGGPEDFEVPQFRRLLLNGILWGLGPAMKP